MKITKDYQEMKAMLDVAADIDERIEYYIAGLKTSRDRLNDYDWPTEADKKAADHKIELAERFRNAVLSAINPVDF